MAFKKFQTPYYLLLTLLVSAMAVTASSSPASNASLLRYSFAPDVCSSERGVFANTYNATNDKEWLVVRNRNATACRPPLGITAATMPSISAATIPENNNREFVSSQQTSRHFLRSIVTKNRGISFSFWIKPDNSTTASDEEKDDMPRRPILTVGRVLQNTNSNNGQLPSVPPPLGLNPCDDSQIDVQLVQSFRSLELLFRTSDVALEPCQRFRLPLAPVNNTNNSSDDETRHHYSHPDLMHVVVSLADKEQRLFVNGKPSATLTRPFSNHLDHWNQNRHRLHLLAYDGGDAKEANDERQPLDLHDVWRGALYQLDIGTGHISVNDVKEMLCQRLPPTEPAVSNHTTIMNEDAERVAGSHEIDWYGSQASVAEASRIVLPVDSLDLRVQQYLQKLQLVPSNATDPFFVYITSLPSTGRLFSPDGTSLGTIGNVTGLLIPLHNTDRAIVYIPPLHALSHLADDGKWSILASFDYCVSRLAIRHVRQCRSSATVHVVVRPVNDPPTATSSVGLTIVTQPEGPATKMTPVLELGGTDVDVGDRIELVQITNPPAYGRLRLRVGSFRLDGLRHGTYLQDVNYTLPLDGETVHIQYEWNPAVFPGALLSAVPDSFRFRVADAVGSWSSEATVRLQVVPALEIVDAGLHSVNEDALEAGNVVFHARDTSGYNRTVALYVETLPMPHLGVLLDPETSELLKEGDQIAAVLEAPYDAGIAVTLAPAPNYCDSHRGGGTIHFQVVVAALRQDGALASLSSVSTQSIEIKCKRDLLELDVSNTTYTLQQSTLRGYASDACRNALHDAFMTNASTCPTVAMFEGIHVLGKDPLGAQDEVEVTVFAGSGYLTFQSSFWNRTRPIHGRRVLAADYVRFAALPHDLSNILSNIRFESYTIGADAVHIVLQSGNCSSVQVTPWVMPQTTTSCQVLRHAIDVFVERDERADSYESSLITTFPWQLVVCLVGYPTLYFVFVQVDTLLRNARSMDDQEDDDASTTIEEDESHREKGPVWIEHMSEDGQLYYENTADGSVTWMAPVGEEFVQYSDSQEEEAAVNQE